MDFKSLADAMNAQQQENKKDRYIEITDAFIKARPGAYEDLDWLEYISALLDTISYMDPQIYEMYRALEDRFRDELQAGIERRQVGSAKLSALAERAVTMGILHPDYLRKKFDSLGRLNFNINEYKQNMDLNDRYVLARSATFELENAGKYYAEQEQDIYVDKRLVGKLETVVFSVYDLLPDSDVEVMVVNHEEKSYSKIKVHTRAESLTLDVKRMGAKGDGESDDTSFLQAAVLTCPPQGRVLIPAGVYRFTNLFLSSNISIELAEGATLKAIEDRSKYPMLPGAAVGADGKEYTPGTWEGNPLPMFAGVISGIGVENVAIYGRGTIDGGASTKDWWNNPKVKNGAYRPRLVFLNNSRRVVLQGITLKNSPSWTIHPYFSERLGFYNLNVTNPFDSPNTDGLDPESCSKVDIAGVKFSLGDDCIAVKSGKIYMGKTRKTPSSDIRVAHCLMENGHGAVTIGSEMAGGVKNLSVSDCVFSHTDRGLRIKTRRGRGKNAVIDGVSFSRIDMDHVMTPFVVNCFYFCDPDGKTDYVQSRDSLPVDKRTPEIKKLSFSDIKAENCHVRAAFFEGLPEKKIKEIEMRNIKVSYTAEPKSDVPAMSCGVEPIARGGLFARNIGKLTLDNVTIEGTDGEVFDISEVDSVEK